MGEMGAGFSIGLIWWSFEWMNGWHGPRLSRHDRGCYFVGISIYT